MTPCLRCLYFGGPGSLIETLPEVPVSLGLPAPFHGPDLLIETMLSRSQGPDSLIEASFQPNLVSFLEAGADPTHLVFSL